MSRVPLEALLVPQHPQAVDRLLTRGPLLVSAPVSLAVMPHQCLQLPCTALGMRLVAVRMRLGWVLLLIHPGLALTWTGRVHTCGTQAAVMLDHLTRCAMWGTAATVDDKTSDAMPCDRCNGVCYAHHAPIHHGCML